MTYNVHGDYVVNRVGAVVVGAHYHEVNADGIFQSLFVDGVTNGEVLTANEFSVEQVFAAFA